MYFPVHCLRSLLMVFSVCVCARVSSLTNDHLWPLTMIMLCCSGEMLQLQSVLCACNCYNCLLSWSLVILQCYHPRHYSKHWPDWLTSSSHNVQVVDAAGRPQSVHCTMLSGPVNRCTHDKLQPNGNQTIIDNQWLLSCVNEFDWRIVQQTSWNVSGAGVSVWRHRDC